MPAAAQHKGLRKTLFLLALTLDHARVSGPERALAFVVQAYKAAHVAARDPSKDWRFAWPLLGVEDPDLPPRAPLTSVELTALAAFHRDRATVDRYLKGRQSGGGSALDADGNVIPDDEDGGTKGGRKSRGKAKSGGGKGPPAQGGGGGAAAS